MSKVVMSKLMRGMLRDPDAREQLRRALGDEPMSDEDRIVTYKGQRYRVEVGPGVVVMGDSDPAQA